MQFKAPSEKKVEETYHSPWAGLESDKIKSQPEEPAPKKPRTKMKWGIFFTALLIGVIAISVYFIFGGPAGKPSVSLEFSRPSQVLLGESFDIDISFSNFSDDILKNVRLSLTLPDGVSFLGQPMAQRVMEQLVGDLGPGSLGQETFSLIVTEGSQSLKHLEARLIYSAAPNQKITFESRTEVDVRVGQPAVSLEIEAPESVFSGENFEMRVSYRNNTKDNIENLNLRIDYSPIFKFEESSERPDTGNNFWEIGTLSPGASHNFTINGSVVGQEGSFSDFNAVLSVKLLGQEYVVNSQMAKLGISKAPLSLTVVANNSADYIARIGDSLKYTLTYKNNSDFPLRSVTITAKLVGELFDFQTARANAAFNSLTNTFTWTTADVLGLANLAPGEQGSVDLSIKLKSAFPIRRLSDRNFVLKIEGEIESPTVPLGVDARRTVSVAKLETKVAGDLEIDALAFYRDAASGILNSGPYPPRVNQATEYTIHWRVKNYATNVSNVVVSAFLQSGARFTGVVKSNIGSEPTYNQNSNKITWQIDELPATKGVISEPAEAIFQVELTPAVNQIGKQLDILGKTDIRGQDDFTGMTLVDIDTELRTDLPDDNTVSGETRVQP